VGKEASPDAVIAGAAAVIDRSDVAAGAEGAITLGVKDDQLDRGVVPPVVQRRMDRAGHVMGQCVQRLRAGQGDAAGVAVAADMQVVHQPLSDSMARLTISRMISLVPSRIWWTRRSRTIFST